MDPDALLAALGELYLLTQAFVQRQQLPATEQPAVRLRAGVNQLDPGGVRDQQPGVVDTWRVLSQRTEQDQEMGCWGGGITVLPGSGAPRRVATRWSWKRISTCCLRRRSFCPRASTRARCTFIPALARSGPSPAGRGSGTKQKPPASRPAARPGSWPTPMRPP